MHRVSLQFVETLPTGRPGLGLIQDSLPRSFILFRYRDRSLAFPLPLRCSPQIELSYVQSCGNCGETSSKHLHATQGQTRARINSFVWCKFLPSYHFSRIKLSNNLPSLYLRTLTLSDFFLTSLTFSLKLHTLLAFRTSSTRASSASTPTRP